MVEVGRERETAEGSDAGDTDGDVEDIYAFFGLHVIKRNLNDFFDAKHLGEIQKEARECKDDAENGKSCDPWINGGYLEDKEELSEEERGGWYTCEHRDEENKKHARILHVARKVGYVFVVAGLEVDDDVAGSHEYSLFNERMRDDMTHSYERKDRTEPREPKRHEGNTHVFTARICQSPLIMKLLEKDDTTVEDSNKPEEYKNITREGCIVEDYIRYILDADEDIE